RFTSKSRHSLERQACPLCAKSGHSQLQSLLSRLLPQVIRIKAPSAVQKTACSDERRCLPSASFLRTLTASGTPEGLCGLSSGFEGGKIIFTCHGDSRLNVRHAAPPRRSQHRRSCGFLIGEFANDQPIIVAERQVPTDEFASNTFEEFGNRFLT